ncbi:hypothetical protein V6Z12_A05G275700 [Gossypium hirsutum]
MIPYFLSIPFVRKTQIYGSISSGQGTIFCLTVNSNRQCFDTKFLFTSQHFQCIIHVLVYMCLCVCRERERGSTWAIKLDKSCMECAASYDSKNDASSGFSTALTCT